MVGDRDQIRPEHTLELYRLLANGQLFVVPGCRHNTFNGRPDLVNPALLSFLDEPMPEERP